MSRLFAASGLAESRRRRRSSDMINTDDGANVNVDTDNIDTDHDDDGGSDRALIGLPGAQFGRSGLGHDSAVGPRSHTWAARSADTERSLWWCPPSAGLLSDAAVAELFAVPSHALLVGPEESEVDVSPTCPQALVAKVQACKTALDRLTERKRFVEARARANPYELLGHAIFQNRAALKLAELDFMLRLTHADGVLPLCTNERGVLYFTDICAGPGGFTEYLYWRTGGRCRGWGLTLAGKSDFNLGKFNPLSIPWSFEPVYGRHDGDITQNSVLEDLAHAVRAGTPDGQGVALCTGDGGLCVEGDENRQEILARHILVGQFAAALHVLRAGGVFVCKMFDCFTPATTDLLFLMRQCFDRLGLVKPIQSRPANSERYVIGVGCHPQRARIVLRVLLEGSDAMRHARRSKLDVTRFVPAIFRHIPASDSCEATEQRTHSDSASAQQAYHDVAEMVRSCNVDVAERQIVALEDLVRYYEDPGLAPPVDQEQVRRKALSLWEVPETLPESSFEIGKWTHVESALATMSRWFGLRWGRSMHHRDLEVTGLDWRVFERVERASALAAVGSRDANSACVPRTTGRLALLIGCRTGTFVLEWCDDDPSKHIARVMPFPLTRLPPGTLAVAEIQESLAVGHGHPDGSAGREEDILVVVVSEMLCLCGRDLRAETAVARMEAARMMLSIPLLHTKHAPNRRFAMVSILQLAEEWGRAEVRDIPGGPVCMHVSLREVILPAKITGSMVTLLVSIAGVAEHGNPTRVWLDGRVAWQSVLPTKLPFGQCNADMTELAQQIVAQYDVATDTWRRARAGGWRANLASLVREAWLLHERGWPALDYAAVAQLWTPGK
jgi:23S rRNA U2552 (ribose-2'-O)-methylase RlmE/FtsJ